MADGKTFTEFYQNLGLREYPFAQWSAEQEQRRRELFIRPTYYGPIDEKFRAGAGMFLVGERGTGKTATLYDLINSARKSDLVVEISDFSSISAKYSPLELYKLISSRVTECIASHVMQFPHCLNKISTSKRLLLSYAYN